MLLITGFLLRLGYLFGFTLWTHLRIYRLLRLLHRLSSSTVTDVSPHRSCVRCTRRMSSVKYDKHTLCLNCRDVQCSLDVRYDECRAWSSLVSKGKKKSTTPSSSSSPLVPAGSVAATVASPLPPLASDERIRDYAHSFLTSFLSQSGSVGSDTNPSFAAPPVVPDSPPVARGCWGSRGRYPIQRVANRTLWRGAINITRGNRPPPNVSVPLHAEQLARSGLVWVMGSPSPGLGLLTSVPSSTDQLRVRGNPVDVNVSVASLLSPTGLLFPFSDSDLASLPPSLPSLSFSASSAPLSSFSSGAIFGCSFLSSYFCSCFLSSFCRPFCAFYVCRCSSSFGSFASSCCYFPFYFSSWPFTFLCSSSFFPSCSSCLFFYSHSCFSRCSFFFRFFSSQSTFCSCFSSFFFFFFFGCLVYLFFPGFRCFSGSLVRFVFGVSVVGTLVFPFGGFGFSFVCSFFLTSSVRGC